MFRGQAFGYGVAAAASRLWDAALAIRLFRDPDCSAQPPVALRSAIPLQDRGRDVRASFAGFRAFADGRRLLVQRPDSVGMLRDRAALQALSPGSLGRKYLTIS